MFDNMRTDGIGALILGIAVPVALWALDKVIDVPQGVAIIVVGLCVGLCIDGVMFMIWPNGWKRAAPDYPLTDLRIRGGQIHLQARAANDYQPFKPKIDQWIFDIRQALRDHYPPSYLASWISATEDAKTLKDAVESQIDFLDRLVAKESGIEQPERPPIYLEPSTPPRQQDSSFVIRPIAGSASGYSHILAGDPKPFEAQVLFAQLEIESRRFLRDCTVTVTAVEEIEPQLRHLHRHKGGPFELSWSEAGDMKRDLTPGVPRRINVARFDQHESYFQIAPGGSQRPKYLSGWYKVTILVASESDDSVVQTYQGKMALGKHQDPPPPLTFWDWEDGDEKRVEFDGIAR